ncbi:TlpA family protein disulfide reductase [Nitrosococcus watsonii]|uniref:Redoxin domain protein n=1 Tax=Nitrosococcus watsoni (strain C-113) TaxID=105559 RepID=D8K567_NITWC|nr:TlpA disulfide reductase family protein [Nitrosococcus watsonii]ADJ28044.1 Redoxin domain protein [Nitrosococcus watsonii C-113]
MNKPRLVFFYLLLVAISAVPTAMAAEISQQAPDCVLKPFEKAGEVTLPQWQGKVVYVDFWASWCPPCLKSFPFLNDLHQRFSDQGLHIVGINVDEKLSDAQDFLARVPARFEIVVDPDQQCARSFDIQAMPSSFLIDRKGVIRHIHLGFRSGDTQELEAWTQKLLQEDTANP